MIRKFEKNDINLVMEIWKNENIKADKAYLTIKEAIAENNLDANETKTYTITMWVTDSDDINGNLNIFLNKTIA